MHSKLNLILDSYKKSEITVDEAKTKIIKLFTVSSNNDFSKYKLGDYLYCTEVYSQSKKYTVGKSYQIFRHRKQPLMSVEIAIRDDSNKISWIPITGFSYTYFNLISNKSE